MKKIIKVLCLCLTIFLCFSFLVYASSQRKDISVFFNDIKILINQGSFLPKDINGNEVEPFIHNGTTYLPVRAIANAFDKDVNWDAEHSTVVLKSKNWTYLDTISYFKKSEYPEELTYVKLSEEGNHAIEMGHWNYEGNKLEFEKIECKQKISYSIDKKYKTFEAALTGNNAKLNIYGDNKLIYTTPIIEDNSEIKVAIDISNYDTIHFEYIADNQWLDQRYIMLDEARLIGK